MTRETKIGLLVGLAFIIVVAILLSDPVNNANEPQAAIGDTASSVRQSLTVPAPTGSANDRSATTIITPNRAPSREPILTPTEAAQQTPQTEVSVGPSGGPLKPIIPTPNSDDSHVAMQQGASGQDNNAVVSPGTPPAHSNTDALQRAAETGGEPVVSINRDSNTPVSTNTSASPGKQRYTAQAGDTLSRMAGRLMGANTKANRAAIIAANPSLKINPDRVIVGASYVIPGAATAVAAPAPSDADAQASPAPDADQTPASTEKQTTRWYVVKPNDNLWRIATDEVGDASAVADIISLNKDVLKGGATLQPNMRLRLPPKTVASAD
jgi:nucleoid-associated protein YgaU